MQDISGGGDGSAYNSLTLEPASPQQPAEGAGEGGARAKSPVQRLDLQGQSAAAPAVMGSDVTAAVVEQAQAGEMGSRLRKAGAKVSENGLFAPFMYQNDHSTKTSSGQT